MPRVSPGVRLMALAALGFSVMSLLARLAAERLPPQQIVLVRAVITLGLSYGTLVYLRIPRRPRQPFALFLRGLFGTISLTCLYYSLAHLPLAEAVIIQHLSPVLTALLAALVLAERVAARAAIATVVSLAGVVLMARPAALFGAGDAPPLPTLPVAIGVLGALGSAIVYVIVRGLRDREDPYIVVLSFPLVAAPLAAPFAIATWVWPTPREWLLLAGVGVSTQLAQVWMTRGLALEPAARATQVSYLQIVFGLVFGVTFLGETPTWLTWVGAAVVVAATTMAAVGRRPPPPPTDGATVLGRGDG